MESYDDDDNRIYDTWLDGYFDKSSGSIIGYIEALTDFGERTIVHGGKQSMPFEYNNVNTPFYSEAEREFSPVQNWTVNGADTLSLWVRGNPVAYVEDAGTITMSAAGHDIWDAADDFRFAHKSLTGNGSVVVKVESLTNTNGWAKAGVMIRQSLDADSKFVYMVVSYTNGVSFGWRQLTAGTCLQRKPGGNSRSAVGQAHPHGRRLHGPVLRRRQDLDRSEERRRHDRHDHGDDDRPGVRGSVRHQPQPGGSDDRGDVRGGITGTVSGSWQVVAIGDDPQPANDPADLYVTIQDSAGKTATATNPTAVTSAEWTQWKIPLSSLTGVNLKAVKKMYIGVGSKTSPVKGGAGKLYIDDIGFGHPAAQ